MRTRKIYKLTNMTQSQTCGTFFIANTVIVAAEQLTHFCQ